MPQWIVKPGEAPAVLNAGNAERDIPSQLVGALHEFPAIPHDSSLLAETRQVLRGLRWVEQDPIADRGHHRFLPDGYAVARAVNDVVYEFIAESIGGFEIHTPAVLRWPDSGSPVVQMGQKFSDRLYHVRASGDHGASILRWGEDPGLFSLLSDADVSSSHLPLKIFEYSEGFRRFQRGELKGIHKARSFSFWSHHTLCRNDASAVDCYVERFQQEERLLRRLHDDWIAVAVVPTPCMDRALPILGRCAATSSAGCVVVDEIPSLRSYWTWKHTFYDATGFRSISGQFDEANAERFDVRLSDQPDAALSTVHASFATVERWLILLVAYALRRRGRRLPAGVAPIQVRVVPDHHREAVGWTQVVTHCRQAGIAVDVDDLDRSVASKRKDAVASLIPFVVTGTEPGNVPVEHRLLDVDHDGTMRRLSCSELVRLVNEEAASWPLRRVMPPVFLSEKSMFASAEPAVALPAS